MTVTRRRFLAQGACLAGASLTAPGLALRPLLREPGSKLRFGLVTYLWGRDWDLDTLIRNCEAAKVLGVELRTEHAHGVEPSLTKAERAEVEQRFADSPVTVLGPGSNEQFHEADPAKVKRAIETTKRFIVLSHDIGGSGVKVKPNGFPKGVEREKTIAQIGAALRECGEFAAEHGQEIRVEVHGRGTQQLPAMRAIMQAADHDQVRTCWNSNGQDLDGEGLEHNFGLVKGSFGQTAHVRELDVGAYPYQQLIDLFVAIDYAGWVCLEARTEPEDRAAALGEQRQMFARMVKEAQRRLAAKKGAEPKKG